LARPDNPLSQYFVKLMLLLLILYWLIINYTTIYNIQSNFNYDINEKLIYLYLDKIKNSVINSIKRRLLSDRPIAFLLSGGVDSSLVASIASTLINKPIYTYCCGFEGGTDLEYAKKVADHIGSIHTEVYLNPDECLESIKDVIYTTETWDTTTIRASVGQYLISKYISNNTDAKVVMVGEGPDEVCSSYLFNFYAPNGNELHETAIEYVSKIHMYDGRRADRCISNWGLEARIALLDPEFISAYWEIPNEWRHPKYNGFNNIIKTGFNNNIEKWWLRKAFENSNILPSEVLWRKKEAFSDGISKKSKSWFEMINDYINDNHKFIVDNYIKCNEYPSIEAFYYKTIFKNYFKNRDNIIPNYWQPKWINKNNEYIDPSARILDIYNN
jgi:asparagine synthase (glutamine-hydrolysing)